MKFCEIFTSIQGEGIYSGMPSIFARVTGCNLRCMFAGGSFCDTAYTSYNPEEPKLSEDDLFKMMDEHPNVRHIVFTGGEPMMYKSALEEVVQKIYDKDDRYIITIETNGTFAPLGVPIDLYSISPKLSTSVPKQPFNVCYEGKVYSFDNDDIKNFNEKRRRFLDNIPTIVSGGWGQIQLKFVYSNEESLEEIKDIISQLNEKICQCCDDIDMNNYVLLMPEGQFEHQLKEKREEVVSKCVEYGWQYTDRLQIMIWGSKRNV